MRKFFVMFLLMAAQPLLAQYDDKDAVAMPSPNSNFDAGSSQVGMRPHTGRLEIAIPLYTLPSKELSFPVSLTYSGGGGIKVQDAAGTAGLGWQLVSGGAITRVVRGLPDETKNGYIGINHAGQTVMTGLTNDLVSKVGKGELDGEPDMFSVTTPFFSLTFVLDAYGNPVFSNGNAYRIKHNLYSNTDTLNTSWVITDGEGNQYFFGSGYLSRERMSTKLFDVTRNFTTTWYLDRIVAYNSTEELNLSYFEGADFSVTNYDVSNTILSTTGPCSTPNNNITNDVNRVNTYKGPKYLSKVVSSLGEIRFDYAFDRQDIASAGRLNTITVYSYLQFNFSQFIKKLRFNYSYFGAPSSNPEALRLKLDNIQVNGGTDATPVLTYKSFEYNTNVNLPVRNSVEYDYWGYYNHNPSGTVIAPAANKEPDLERTKAGVLTAIEDISGSITQFEYQLNTYYDQGLAANVPAGGLRVSRLKEVLPSGEQTYTDYIYDDANGRSTGQIYSNSYKNFSKNINVLVLNGSGQACVITGKNTRGQSIYNIHDLNGNFVGYSSVKELDQDGGYEVSQFTNFSDFPDQFNYNNTNGQVYGYENARQLSAATSYAYKRGLLRFKTQYRSNGDKITETENQYTALDMATKATGVRATAMNYILGSNIQSWIYGVYQNNVENYVLTKTIAKVYDQHNQSLFDESTTDYTYAANHWVIQTTTAIDSKGAARSETDYYPGDANIPNVTAEEQAAINSMIAANNIRDKVHTTESVNGTAVHTHYSYKNFIDQGLKNIVLLTGTTSYTNNNTADWQVKKNEYQYDFNNLQISSTITNGDVAQSMIYGHNNSLVIAEVTNAVNRSWVTANQSTADGNFNFYYGGTSPQSASIKVDYTGNVTFSLTFDGYIPQNAFVDVRYVLSGTAGYYSDYICISQDATCDAYNHVTLQNVPPGNYTLTVYRIDTEYSTDVNFIFSYTYPTLYGTVEYEKEFFYEGFEEYWIGSTWIACAGKKSMGGDYTVPFMKPNNRAYQVDYHYYENGKWYAASKTYDDYMTLSDGLAIDEVRVYPKDAKMKHYCYDPLVGMIGQVDESNRVTTYEYDALGRLVITRDQDGNITEKVCYTYAGQTENCISYGNEAQTRMFTRYCGDDAIGSQVPMTVPANTFFSVSSQEDANLKALGHLYVNGPGHANANGSCTPIYWNEERIKYFYSQTCAANTIPEPYPATLRARSVYSLNSVAEANQMADAQLDIWGQDEANIYGSCAPTTVNVEYDLYNNIHDLRVTFYNVNSGEVWDFDMGSHGTLDPIPIGTYDVTIYDPSETYSGYTIQICNNYTDYGPPATLYGVYLSPNCKRIVIW